jgi:DNA-binding NarL/FixJ family response regulator
MLANQDQAMSSNLCKILVIEDDTDQVHLLKRLLSHPENSSLAQGLSFITVIADCLQQGLEQIKEDPPNVIVLDLSLPDSRGIEALVQLRRQAPKIPIIVQIEHEDENLAIKAFQLGADGYIETQNLDSNLLIYQIRLVLEKQQYVTNLEIQKQQQQQEQEFQVLENLIDGGSTNITARMFGAKPIRESVPDIFAEIMQTYSNLLDLALEQRAFRVEYNISERLRSLADKLGFLKASPRDVIDIHTTTLRKKNQDATLAKAQAYVTEGRLMVLELMGYLTSFYRKYYIGLSTINIFSKSDHSQ